MAGNGAPRELRPGQVVTFEHTDPILGVTFRDVGVVWGVEEGGPVRIRPLAAAELHVDPANVMPITGDDVPAAAE